MAVSRFTDDITTSRVVKTWHEASCMSVQNTLPDMRRLCIHAIREETATLHEQLSYFREREVGMLKLDMT